MPKEPGKDGRRALTVSPAHRLETIRKELASLSVEDLRKELVERLTFSADHLIRMAMLVAELESRGENLRGFRIGLLPYLRQIAVGKLLPELVVKFAGTPNTLKAVSNLPINEQLKIANGEREYQPDTKPASKPAIKRSFSPVQTRFKERTNVYANDDDDDDDDADPVVPVATKQDKEEAMRNIASKGSPRDVAEMVWTLIGNSSERPMVLQHFFRLLIESGAVKGELAKHMRDYTAKTVSAVVWDTQAIE
jgi:hypothetical protein